MSIVAAAVTVLSGCASRKQVEPGLQVGAGVMDIAPGDKDALDPLLAKALVFRQDNKRAAIEDAKCSRAPLWRCLMN
jgi:hypothetical protein